MRLMLVHGFSLPEPYLFSNASYGNTVATLGSLLLLYIVGQQDKAHLLARLAHTCQVFRAVDCLGQLQAA